MSEAPILNLADAAIGQIAVRVLDLDRATAFYRDVLGVNFLFAAPNLAFFDAGGTRLMLGVAEKEEFDHPTSILYYRVKDIQGVCRHLQHQGVVIESPPNAVHKTDQHTLWLAFIRDSENNLLGLMHEAPSADNTE